jgi:hypothetical protein
MQVSELFDVVTCGAGASGEIVSSGKHVKVVDVSGGLVCQTPGGREVSKFRLLVG